MRLSIEIDVPEDLDPEDSAELRLWVLYVLNGLSNEIIASEFSKETELELSDIEGHPYGSAKFVSIN